MTREIIADKVSDVITDLLNDPSDEKVHEAVSSVARIFGVKDQKDLLMIAQAMYHIETVALPGTEIPEAYYDNAVGVNANIIIDVISGQYADAFSRCCHGDSH